VGWGVLQGSKWPPFALLSYERLYLTLGDPYCCLLVSRKQLARDSIGVSLPSGLYDGTFSKDLFLLIWLVRLAFDSRGARSGGYGVLIAVILG